MAPSATESEAQPQVEVPVHPGKANTFKPAVKSTGVLDKYENFDVTPVVGREFPTANVVEWLQAPNSDELIRELALTSMSPAFSALPKLTALSFPTRRRLLQKTRQLDRRPPKRADPENRSPFRKTIHLRPTHPSHPQL